VCGIKGRVARDGCELDAAAKREKRDTMRDAGREPVAA